MKLIFCPDCQDIVRLTTEKKTCACGKSGGYYLIDGINATVWGIAVPIGFSNDSFITALKHRPKEGLGARFEAFVIPETCDTILVKKKRPTDIRTVVKNEKT